MRLNVTQEGLQAHYEKRRGSWKHTYTGEGTDVTAGAPNILGTKLTKRKSK